MKPACRICGNTEANRVHAAREMMFGTRDPFEYSECGGCSTVQIAEVPDLKSYYPPNYYSFNTPGDGLPQDILRRTAAKIVGRHLVHGPTFFGTQLEKHWNGIKGCFPPSIANSPFKIDLDSKILDFGCGNGQLLRTMRFFGFRDVTGADAYIEKEIVYPDGIRILKVGLSEIEERFDLIMFHHSFEHLPEPLGALSEVVRLLRPGGYCLIRIPVIGDAWQRYRTDWVQLDPPRHLFLFSEDSLRLAAEGVGLKVESVSYDSTAFQFWGSELYRCDMPLFDKNTNALVDPARIFSMEQLAAWQSDADDLNGKARGDQACFYVRLA